MNFEATKNEKIRGLKPKQLKLLEGLLTGLPTDQALVSAGYSAKSRNNIGAIKKVYQELMEAKQQELIASTMSKAECIAILKSIASTSESEKNKIAAIAQLSRMMGYDAPTNINTNAVQQVQIVFTEDKSIFEVSQVNSAVKGGKDEQSSPSSMAEQLDRLPE